MKINKPKDKLLLTIQFITWGILSLISGRLCYYIYDHSIIEENSFIYWILGILLFFVVPMLLAYISNFTYEQLVRTKSEKEFIRKTLENKSDEELKSIVEYKNLKEFPQISISDIKVELGRRKFFVYIFNIISFIVTAYFFFYLGHILK